MEAIAALGVAGNVVQFLDFGQKLISTSLEIYTAGTGVTVSNKESETLLKDFIESIDTVSENLLQYDTRLGEKLPQATAQNGLQDIINDCRNLAAELLVRFEKLKLQRKPGRWQSTAKAVQCMWQDSELVGLQQRLSKYQSQLAWHILLSLRQDFTLMADRQVDQFTEFQNSMTQTLSDEIRRQWEILPRWPIPEVKEDSDKNGRDSSVPLIPLKVRGTRGEDKLTLLSAGNGSSKTIEESIIQDTAHGFATKLAEIESEVWNSLTFPIMTDREDEIADAELQTFDWIFKRPRSKDRRWDNYLKWLETGDGLYWINGKAGSGKSTLMKHLFNHDLTRQALNHWAGNLPLAIAGFFFWYSGGELQKTQVGLLRSLLYQYLKNHRELIPVVLSESLGLTTTDLAGHWTLSRLKRAFARLIHQDICPLKICIFVDGLDEYHGDHSEIARLFVEVGQSKHVKVCVSSRPLLVFERGFGSFPGLSLQNLTFDDIKIYVKSRLGDNERMKELKYEEPELQPRLIDEILNKAAGVFLWVKLVVQSLMEGIGNFDRGEDLERRLQELPDDLEDLYWHMLGRVKPSWYLEEGFRLLLLVKAAHHRLTLRQLCFAETPDLKFAILSEPLKFSQKKQKDMCISMRGRTKSRCLGLLEVSNTAETSPTKQTVQFLHKSVKDFLETPNAQRHISKCLCGKGFDPDVQLMSGFLIELKHISELNALKREAWFDHAKPLIRLFMNHARRAEENSQGAQVELVDELDNVARWLWGLVTFKAAEEKLMHWSVAKRRPPRADNKKNYTEGSRDASYVKSKILESPDSTAAQTISRIQPTFAFFAAQQGLRHYLSAKGETEALAYANCLYSPSQQSNNATDSNPKGEGTSIFPLSSMPRNVLAPDLQSERRVSMEPIEAYVHEDFSPALSFPSTPSNPSSVNIHEVNPRSDISTVDYSDYTSEVSGEHTESRHPRRSWKAIQWHYLSESLFSRLRMIFKQVKNHHPGPRPRPAKDIKDRERDLLVARVDDGVLVNSNLENDIASNRVKVTSLATESFSSNKNNTLVLSL
ncbi:uncharacterized protein K444DRAFT_626482 [Hyaloscypha bicolor E]|uniref:Uncharacterized protein n=1 Tax=Hyaloscypha bicolor E TaxID=1095630 RepID=A0A2J6TL94_9HELO|nr:uncharacterized protein K444DRAFT_626482 [Hyaloscypha bicolor E]PMD63790.1 hypothetical protein K444DRAFT_626482 [Hyaloscypha bicolor E]